MTQFCSPLSICGDSWDSIIVMCWELAVGKRASSDIHALAAVSSPKTPVSPAPSWFLHTEKPKYAKVTAKPNSSCDSANVYSSPHVFPNMSSYPLCQEFILTSCFSSPINNSCPYPPSWLWSLHWTFLLHYLLAWPFSSFLGYPIRISKLRSGKVRVKNDVGWQSAFYQKTQHQPFKIISFYPWCSTVTLATHWLLYCHFKV